LVEQINERETKIKTLRNGFRWQVQALEILQEMLDSYNVENPWLGITAAIALLQMKCGEYK